MYISLNEVFVCGMRDGLMDVIGEQSVSTEYLLFLGSLFTDSRRATAGGSERVCIELSAGF